MTDDYNGSQDPADVFKSEPSDDMQAEIKKGPSSVANGPNEDAVSNLEIKKQKSQQPPVQRNDDQDSE